jgi:hypothetical protein
MWTAPPPIDAGADIDAALHLIAQRVISADEDLEPHILALINFHRKGRFSAWRIG